MSVIIVWQKTIITHTSFTLWNLWDTCIKLAWCEFDHKLKLTLEVKNSLDEHVCVLKCTLVYLKWKQYMKIYQFTKCWSFYHQCYANAEHGFNFKKCFLKFENSISCWFYKSKNPRPVFITSSWNQIDSLYFLVELQLHFFSN